MAENGGLWSIGAGLQRTVWWLLAMAIAVLLAAIVWAIVTPVSPLGDWRPDSAKVLPTPLRKTLYAAVDPFNRGPAMAAPGSQAGGTVTSLTLVLFGTRGLPGGGGSAIIAGEDGVQQVYRAGDEVTPGVTLAEVAFNHVVLMRNGAKELLYIDQSGKAPSARGLVAANPVPSPGGVAGNAPAGGAGALTVDAARRGISFGPRAESGRIVGLEVLPTADGSAFRSAGFQPGDVVTAVDGKPVTGAGDGAMLAGALRPGASVSVTVRRGDRQLPLAITLAP
ncbi:type II secretion system protein N [Novosphingobium sp. EMRT-2]|uniref:type II secretion system protein N n=1 Tax=Novosphingobium sp. EMRT-2 TaxID=2571749 RepID=UPI00143D0ED3|nr:type II secretion system protein N [Novosphingobium sp. EMRT-2]